jgi:hypothetical protein
VDSFRNKKKTPSYIGTAKNGTLSPYLPSTCSLANPVPKFLVYPVVLLFLAHGVAVPGIKFKVWHYTTFPQNCYLTTVSRHKHNEEVHCRVGTTYRVVWLKVHLPTAHLKKIQVRCIFDRGDKISDYLIHLSLNVHQPMKQT